MMTAPFNPNYVIGFDEGEFFCVSWVYPDLVLVSIRQSELITSTKSFTHFLRVIWVQYIKDAVLLFL